MSVRVRFVDKDGNTVKLFSSLNEAAVEANCTASTLGWRIKNKHVFGGLRAEYMPIDLNEEQELRRLKWRERAAIQKIRKSETQMTDSYEKDSMSIEQKEKLLEEFEKKGIRFEIVKYELRNGLVSITPCKKKDNGDSNVWPMVGSAKCVVCRYFKGRCRETKEVICGFCYKK